MNDEELRKSLRDIAHRLKCGRELTELQAVEEALHLIKQDREAAKLHAVPDLAWCLGKLRGLGHPNEAMEKRHWFQEKQKGGEDE